MLAATVSGRARGQEIDAIPGNPPDLRRPIDDCSFAPRCKYVISDCLGDTPAPVVSAPGRYACCVRTGDLGQAAKRSFG